MGESDFFSLSRNLLHFSGWLSFGGKNKTEEVERQPKIEPATPLPLRYSQNPENSDPEKML